MNKKLSDVLDLPIKIDVSSLTEEERGELQKELFSVGITWYITGMKKVCDVFARYYFIKTNMYLTYSDDDCLFENHSNKEISVQQLKEKIKMCKQFSKSDLKDGMVVKYRGGGAISNKNNGLRLVLCGQFISDTGYAEFDEYLEDLSLETSNPTFDIVEVFTVIDASAGLNRITEWELKSIWKREELSERDKKIISIREKMLELEKQLETLQDAKQQ